MSLLEIFLALIWIFCVALLIHSHIWHTQVHAERAQGSTQLDAAEQEQ